VVNHAIPATQAPAIAPISNANTNGIDFRNKFCIETFQRFGDGPFCDHARTEQDHFEESRFPFFHAML
jgi:hypothetical protein